MIEYIIGRVSENVQQTHYAATMITRTTDTNIVSSLIDLGEGRLGRKNEKHRLILDRGWPAYVKCTWYLDGIRRNMGDTLFEIKDARKWGAKEEEEDWMADLRELIKSYRIWLNVFHRALGIYDMPRDIGIIKPIPDIRDSEDGRKRPTWMVPVGRRGLSLFKGRKTREQRVEEVPPEPRDEVKAGLEEAKKYARETKTVPRKDQIDRMSSADVEDLAESIVEDSDGAEDDAEAILDEEHHGDDDFDIRM